MKYWLLGLAFLGPVIGHAAVYTPDIGQGWLVERAAVLEFLDPGVDGSSREMRIAAGSGRLFGMPELPMRSLSLDLVHHRRRLSLTWNAAGQRLWREDALKMELQPCRGPGPVFDVVYDRSVCAGCAARSVLLVAIGLRIPINDRGAVRYVHDLPLEWQRLPKRGRRPMLSLDYSLAKWLAALGLDRDYGSSPIVGISVHYLIARNVSLGWRAEPSTSQWGGLLSVGRGKLLLRTSHLVHARLGITHRFEISCGFGTAE